MITLLFLLASMSIILFIVHALSPLVKRLTFFSDVMYYWYRNLLGDRGYKKMRTRLRYLRRMNVLTQEELAIKAGLSKQTIVNVERNFQEPTVITLRKLAAALGIKPTELFTEDDKQADGPKKDKPLRVA